MLKDDIAVEIGCKTIQKSKFDGDEKTNINTLMSQLTLDEEFEKIKPSTLIKDAIKPKHNGSKSMFSFNEGVSIVGLLSINRTDLARITHQRSHIFLVSVSRNRMSGTKSMLEARGGSTLGQ